MMRSKWLDWQPSDEIIEKPAHALPTKPTKQGSVGFEGTARAVFLLHATSPAPALAVSWTPSMSLSTRQALTTGFGQNGPTC